MPRAVHDHVEREALTAYLQRDYPGHRVVAIEPLGPDADGDARDGTAKIAGYGQPMRLTLRGPADERVELVWHVATANDLGHDRRADRAAEMLLAYDDFPAIPEHVAAVDLGVTGAGGTLRSIRDYEQMFLITPYAPGTPYAHELRAVAEAGRATDADLARVDRLTRYLGELHRPVSGPARYRRAVRDLIGSGEGIFGVVDAYADDVPGAPRSRLDAIEARCDRWRSSLRGRSGRLVRTHGDFHPFNIVFDGDRLVLLDASRGACGDPADDLTALAVNYVLFAFDHPHGWHGLGPLWRRLWTGYLTHRPDAELLWVAPPWFAWRALVVCNPIFYPKLGAAARSAILGLAERALDEQRLDPRWAEELFR